MPSLGGTLEIVQEEIVAQIMPYWAIALMFCSPGLQAYVGCKVKGEVEHSRQSIPMQYSTVQPHSVLHSK